MPASDTSFANFLAGRGGRVSNARHRMFRLRRVPTMRVPTTRRKPTLFFQNSSPMRRTLRKKAGANNTLVLDSAILFFVRV